MMTMASSANTEASQDEHGGATERLRGEFQNLLGAMGDRAVSSVRNRVEEVTDRLTDYVENGEGGSLVTALKGARDVAQGESPAKALLAGGMSALKGKAKNLFGGGGKGGQGKGLKVTNIEEWVDIGVPVQVAYEQWTRFADFPKFMKKVESVEQESDEKLNWKAQILWSHRTWESTIQQQVPDEKIIWRSKGSKGYVDGAVTFHELAPNLTRVLVALEYHPQGLFEHTGNLWRAQGRRVRQELKHFRRHVMTSVVMHPEEVEGWRGTIEDGTVKDQGTTPRQRRSGAGPDSRSSGNGSEEGGEARAEPAARARRASASQKDKPTARRGSRTADTQARGDRAQQGSRKSTAAAEGDASAAPVRRRRSAQQ
jgi:uncharacterized membrane protein